MNENVYCHSIFVLGNLWLYSQIFGSEPSPDGSEDSIDSVNSVESTGNPFIDEKDSSPITNEKPKPPPKKRNSDETGTKLNDGKPVTPTKPPPLSSKAYRAPPPPNKPAPATRPRVKAIIVSSKMCLFVDCKIMLYIH